MRSSPTPAHRRFDASSLSAPVDRAARVAAVGAGGSERRGAEQGLPTRSHTVAAQGGIGASLGNMDEDNWHYHSTTPVKGGDWLGAKRDRIHVSRGAEGRLRARGTHGDAVDRNPDGTIYQRPLRRPHRQLWREAGARTAPRRPHRPRDAPHAVPAERPARTHFLVEWMALDLTATPKDASSGSPRWRWKPASCTCCRPSRRCWLPRAGTHLCSQQQRFHQHRRRPGDGRRAFLPLQTWSSGSSPHWGPQRRRAADRRLSRRRVRSCATPTASASWNAMHRR